MSLKISFEEKEKAIICELLSKKTGIDDRTGKGNAAERIVQTELLDPFLPPRFKCIKGAVISSKKPDEQSKVIDRVIYDPSAVSPFIYDEAQSVFPIEAVVGLVEITMSLNEAKLRSDIEHMVDVKAMTTRRYFVPIKGTKTRVKPREEKTPSPRSYVIGLPENQNWKPLQIAQSLRSIQSKLGPPTHIHGLYVMGIGFYETIPVENESEQKYRINMWKGPDRLFRFTQRLRSDFDRWLPLEKGWTVDLSAYVQGKPEKICD